MPTMVGIGVVFVGMAALGLLWLVRPKPTLTRRRRAVGIALVVVGLVGLAAVLSWPAWRRPRPPAATIEVARAPGGAVEVGTTRIEWNDWAVVAVVALVVLVVLWKSGLQRFFVKVEIGAAKIEASGERVPPAERSTDDAQSKPAEADPEALGSQAEDV
jgi:hypothetical protein